MDEEFRRRLFKKLRGTDNSSWKELMKKLGVKSHTFYNYRAQGALIPVNFLLKSSQLCNLKPEEIEKHVIWMTTGVKGINKPKLPFNFCTPAGGRFVSAILHDGSLTKELARYCNTSPIMREIVLKASQEIFGDVYVAVYQDRLIYPAIVREILISLGMKTGQKVLVDPSVPRFLTEASEEVIREFLRQAFDDEGSVYFDGLKGGRSVELTLFVDGTGRLFSQIEAPKLLLDIQTMLSKFCIDSNGPHLNKARIRKYRDKWGNGRIIYPWRIRIQGRSNLETFYEKIGFDIPEKMMQLEKCVKTYKRRYVSRGRKLKNIFDHFLEIERLFGYVNKRTLAVQMNYPEETIRQYLRQLESMGLVRKVRQAIWIKNTVGMHIGKEPSRYKSLGSVILPITADAATVVGDAK
ncbi:MAG: LAGLIDADG family homing endonuclease [Candidatus Hadarchaeaceae archaeon]